MKKYVCIVCIVFQNSQYKNNSHNGGLYFFIFEVFNVKNPCKDGHTVFSLECFIDVTRKQRTN